MVLINSLSGLHVDVTKHIQQRCDHAMFSFDIVAELEGYVLFCNTVDISRLADITEHATSALLEDEEFIVGRETIQLTTCPI